MAVIGDLVARLGIDSRGFSSGLQKAKSGLSKFGSMATSLINPITAGFAAMAAGAASAGLTIYGITNRIATLAGIADKATQTGLSGKFLQRLGYAADQSGVSIETLQKSIGKLTVLTGQGSGAFAKLGIDLDKLRAMSPEEQFLSVAEAIGSLPTAAERAAAAVSVFGKSGLEMTGLLSGGMKGVNALMAEAQKLGIGLSDEALAKASAADDAIQRMKASFGGLISQVAVTLAPAFKSIADYITSWLPPITAFLDKFNQLPQKMKFIGEVLAAGFDVGIEHIKTKWQTMLTDMANATARFAVDVALTAVDPTGLGAAAINAARGGGGAQAPAGGPNAQARLDALLKPFNEPAAPPAAGPGLNQFVGPQRGFGGVLDNFRKNEAAKGKQMGDWMKSMLPDAKRIGSSLLDTAKGVGSNLAGIGTGTAATKTQEGPRFAGAMQKGSAEAFRTILANVANAGKSAEVTVLQQILKGAQNNAKVIAAAVANNKPQFVAEFTV